MENHLRVHNRLNNIENLTDDIVNNYVVDYAAILQEGTRSVPTHLGCEIFQDSCRVYGCRCTNASMTCSSIFQVSVNSSYRELEYENIDISFSID